MTINNLNLLNDSWIRVLRNDTGDVETVSLDELFRNTSDYRDLAGETKTQDLAVLRFLLAILTTVYSRVNAEGGKYSWVQLNDEDWTVLSYEDVDEWQDDLWATWRTLDERGRFGDEVLKYLQKQSKHFQLFGDPGFYQVTKEQYDSFVPADKRVEKGKGTVALKQLNRTISESNNSVAVFSPRVEETKNKMDSAELVRWLITYQNFTGVTDKTKVVSQEKFSNSKGWLFGLNSVYAVGRNLHETLMLNLILFDTKKEADYVIQRPVWEENLNQYVEYRLEERLPDNLSQLFTAWSRLLYVDLSENGEIVIYSAGLPMYSTDNALIEPMTTWHKAKDDKKQDVSRPSTRTLQTMGRALWRSFGQFVDTRHDNEFQKPGIVDWLDFLQHQDIAFNNNEIYLRLSAMISDGNATSQSPAAEVNDELTINAEVLFDSDDDEYWPYQIEEAIEYAQSAGNIFWRFVTTTQTLREGSSRVQNKGAVDRVVSQYYDRLNEPFRNWLQGLTVEDDRDEKLREWHQTVQRIAKVSASSILEFASPRELRGRATEQGESNIFTAYSQFLRQLKSLER